MAVYKTEQYGSDAHTESRETTLVASVNSQQPRVSRVANAIKVDGQLNSSITTIRLELFKLEDCRAEFICEVIAVIKPRTSDSLTVPYLCDTVTDGGGWIIIQRRTTGNVDFYRNWADYKKGFGTLDDDFWLGNDNIHAVTSSGQYELRIDLRYKGKSAYAHYDKFALADEHEKYTISLGSYDGTAGDSLVSHRNKPFSTYDQDNDMWPRNCAVSYLGAWWYEHCHDANLNGKWGEGSYKGLRWSSFSNQNSVSFSEMKIRRV